MRLHSDRYGVTWSTRVRCCAWQVLPDGAEFKPETYLSRLHQVSATLKNTAERPLPSADNKQVHDHLYIPTQHPQHLGLMNAAHQL